MQNFDTVSHRKRDKQFDSTKSKTFEDLDEEISEKIRSLEGDDYEKWLQVTAQEEQEKEQENEKESEIDFSTSPASSSSSSGISENSGDGERINQSPPGLVNATFEPLDIKEAEAKSISLGKVEVEEDFRKNPKVDQVEDGHFYYLLGMQLESRKRILADLDRQLQREAAQGKIRKLEFQKQWGKVAAKQHGVEEAMKKFNELQLECREKQKLTNQVYEKEANETCLYNQQIRVNKKKLTFLTQLLKTCEERFEKNRMYVDYLRDVKVESTGQFKTNRQVIDRAQNLLLARDKLIDWEWQNQRDMIESSKELYQTTQIRTKKNLLQSIFLEEMRKYHEARKNEEIMLGETMDLAKEAVANQTMMTGKIALSINNLYIEMCKQLGIKPKVPFPSQDVQTQLNGIEMCMNELIKLSTRIRQYETSSSANVAISVHSRVNHKLPKKKRTTLNMMKTKNDVKGKNSNIESTIEG